MGSSLHAIVYCRACMLAEPGSARSISYLSADSCEHGGLSFYLFWPHTLIFRMYSVDLLVTQTVWPFLELYKGRSNCFVETRQLVLLDIEVLKYFLEFVTSVAHSSIRRYHFLLAAVCTYFTPYTASLGRCTLTLPECPPFLSVNKLPNFSTNDLNLVTISSFRRLDVSS